MISLRWPAALAVAGLAVLASGCGPAQAPAAASSHQSSPAAKSAEPAMETLQANIAAAVKKAVSVHITASLVYGGQRVDLNADVTKSGDVSGIFGQGRTRVRLLAIGRRTYVKVTPAVLAQANAPAAACALMCGKWVKAPSAVKGDLIDSGWSRTVKPFLIIVSQSGLTPAGSATVDGQPVWNLDVVGGGSVSIPQHGTSYPLAVTVLKEQLSFSQWNSVTIPSPPPASAIFNVGQL